MRSAPHLFNEDTRLAALAEYDLAGTDELVDLDNVVRLAARLFNVPIVLVSIIDRYKQVFKARLGLDVCETGRKISFCAHALDLPPQDMLIVPDATLDIRFASNPLVTGDPHIRFYAGVPLRSPGGHTVGTLCIIDRRPRNSFSDADQDNLKTMAAIVLDRLEMRRLDAARLSGQSRFENIAATSPDGIICADAKGLITFWNGAAEAMFGFSPHEAIGSPIDIIVPERMRGGHGGGLQRVAGGGPPHLVGTTVELDAEHKNGSEFPIELSLSMWRNDGAASFGAIIRDISERRLNEDRLFKLAHLDELTGLPNRGVLMKRITEAAVGSEPAALMMIDLDGFKDVNDTLGHTAGDTVLRIVASRILQCARPIDTVARLGGDEFAVMMPGRNSHARIADEADCIISSLASPIMIEDQPIYVSASVGIAMFPDDGAHAEDLLSAADLAMYQAKEEGRDCRRFFNSALREAAVGRRAFGGEIRRAFENGEFELFYQPQVDLKSGHMSGVEALLRWNHPSEGLLGPDRFLSAIESGLLAAEIGGWVMDRACADAVKMRRAFRGLVVGVNLFSAQFRSGRLASEVRECLGRYRLPPDAIELEITENIILRHDDTMMEPLLELRAFGVGIAFDDFGTGFASLSMLKRYPLTRIKIDRSFVRDVCEDEADAAIVTAMVYLAHSLKIGVIAEGVETEAQSDLLRASGCNTVQGYLYGKPMTLKTLLAGAGPIGVATDGLVRST